MVPKRIRAELRLVNATDVLMVWISGGKVWTKGEEGPADAWASVSDQAPQEPTGRAAGPEPDYSTQLG